MIFIGTSGWQYKQWRQAFYPARIPQRSWLEHYSARFQTVEVNNTFYNLPDGDVFEHWKRQTPADFVFALKMSRFLTHLKRLREPEEAVDRFLDRARSLGAKRGPILLQLPPTMKADAGRLDAALAAFPRSERVAVEFRHESWFVPEIHALLERRGAALCLADAPGRKQPYWRTADWGMLRFHEGRGPHAPGYSRSALRTWAARTAQVWGPDRDVFAYFNNDTAGWALRDAVVFAELAARAGLSPSRVPDEAAIGAVG
ncbi:MAG TPA: DUF72 domain-containing protein [Candidatus Dormibacteraeota bacterium]|nr:DUF72 domain-containing protein [Candidatus Dormibacteraeota bacterium]